MHTFGRRKEKMNKLSSLPHSMEVTYLTVAEKEMSLVAFHHEKSNTPNSGTKKKKKKREKILAASFHGRSD